MTPGARLFHFLCLLWLVGMSTRITILAVPPVIPLIREDLRMTETQVGLLVGLPVLTWALAAIPGSLLIARLGATFTLAAGLALTGLAAAGARRGAGRLGALCGNHADGLRHRRHAAGPADAGAGMGPASNRARHRGLEQRHDGRRRCRPALTIPFVLPLLDQSWRLAFLWWAAPVLVLALAFRCWRRVTPRSTSTEFSIPRRWWPDWKNPLIWLLGLTFGANNSLYYGTNAFLPDYLASAGRADLSARRSAS